MVAIFLPCSTERVTTVWRDVRTENNVFNNLLANIDINRDGQHIPTSSHCANMKPKRPEHKRCHLVPVKWFGPGEGSIKEPKEPKKVPGLPVWGKLMDRLCSILKPRLSLSSEVMHRCDKSVWELSEMRGSIFEKI